MSEKRPSAPASLRLKILAVVVVLGVFSILGSTWSLWRVSEVNGILDRVNRFSVPATRLLTQLQTDLDVLSREMDRTLGISHWKDPHWTPRSIPLWLQDVLTSEVLKLVELSERSEEAPGKDWARTWAKDFRASLESFLSLTERLRVALERKDEAKAQALHAQWMAVQDEMKREVARAQSENERSLRQGFSRADGRVGELTTALQTILVLLVGLSLFVAWLGERALRPLSELTRVASEIARRGVRKEDKTRLPALELTRNDEVSTLAREFHRMTTALLERERTVEVQRDRLETMGQLNESVLRNFPAALVVLQPRPDGTGEIIEELNGRAEALLGIGRQEALGQESASLERLGSFLLKARASSGEWSDPFRGEGGEFFRARLLHVAAGAPGQPRAVLLIEDMTQEMELRDRLRSAEQLAAIGRLTAQVAHDVRNPLHSIGLEAEMALEQAERILSLEGATRLRSKNDLSHSLHSIQESVARLEKVTEGYLKLSRPADPNAVRLSCDLRAVVETVVAIYASHCASLGIQVDWSFKVSGDARVAGDPQWIEQALGNLFKNSVQALTESKVAEKRITITLRDLESGRLSLELEDTGPGIPDSVEKQLFEPFVTTRASGTGLGLSFVLRVAQDTQSEIRYKKAQAGGARFEWLFQRALAQAAESRTLDGSHPLSG